MALENEISLKKTLTPKNLEDLMKKVEAIAQGQNRDLLLRFIDILYKQEYFGEEIFSPEDLADIQAGREEIRRGDTISWIDFKKENNL
jgi:hypothetical protein